MEVTRIEETETPDRKSGVTSGIVVDSEVDSFIVKSFSLEEIATSKHRSKASKLDSQVRQQNCLDSISFLPPARASNGLETSNGRGEIYPTTPSPKRETIDVLSASDQTDELEVLSDCETPTGSLFDPFAPGPEELALAPKKKMLREFKIPTRRQLNFDCCDSDEKTDLDEKTDSDEKTESLLSDDDSHILELIYQSFIELIVSNELEEICNRNMMEEDNFSNDASDCFKTPTSVPLLTGIAETCPDAPMRPNYKARKLDQSFCRKLDFESYLI